MSVSSAAAVLAHVSPYVDHVTSSVVVTIFVEDDVTVPTVELAEERRVHGHLL